MYSTAAAFPFQGEHGVDDVLCLAAKVIVSEVHAFEEASAEVPRQPSE